MPQRVRFLVALLVAAGFALAATSAGASDAELSPREGPPGTSVLVRGVFTKTPDDVTVRFRGESALVLERDEGRLRFLVPADAKLGRADVEVVAKGVRVKATFTVLAHDTRRDHAGAPAPALIHDVKLAFVGSRAIVTGTADLPKGFTLAVALVDAEARDAVLASTKAVLAAPAFRVALGPFEGKVLLGRYAADVSFELARQSGLARRDFHGAESAWARAFAEAGTERDRAQRAAELAAHYAAFAKEAAALREALETAHDAATHPVGKDRRFVQRGRFDAEAWKAWHDAAVTKPLRDLAGRQRAKDELFLGARWPEASSHARSLLDELRKLADLAPGSTLPSRAAFEEHRARMLEAVRPPS